MSIEANGHTNGEMEEVSAQEQAPSGASFDVVARGLANGTVSRRKALRLLAVGLVGSAVGFTPGVAAAKKCFPQNTLYGTHVGNGKKTVFSQVAPVAPVPVGVVPFPAEDKIADSVRVLASFHQRYFVGAERADGSAAKRVLLQCDRSPVRDGIDCSLRLQIGPEGREKHSEPNCYEDKPEERKEHKRRGKTGSTCLASDP